MICVEHYTYAFSQKKRERFILKYELVQIDKLYAHCMHEIQ